MHFDGVYLRPAFSQHHCNSGFTATPVLRSSIILTLDSVVVRCATPDYESSPHEREEDSNMPHFCAMKPSTSFDVTQGLTFRQMLKCLCLCGQGVAGTVEEELLDEVSAEAKEEQSV